MTPAEAATLLKIAPGADVAAVRAAYAAAMIADHPDHGGAGTLIERLKHARDTLMCQGEISPCKLCRGVGYSRSRFGAQTCTACGGSGDQP